MTDNPEKDATKETLARVDERTKSIQAEIQNLRVVLVDAIKDSEARQKTETDDLRALHRENSQEIDKLREELYGEMSEKYVLKESFDPIKKLSYALIGFVLMGIIGAGMTLVFKSSAQVQVQSQHIERPSITPAPDHQAN